MTDFRLSPTPLLDSDHPDPETDATRPRGDFEAEVDAETGDVELGS